MIIRLPGVAFKDNTHVGAFVTEVSVIQYHILASYSNSLTSCYIKLLNFIQICSRIHSSRGKDKRFEQLFISKDTNFADVPCHLFVDTAVYSRNRCFRLHLSSKAGKTSVLLPTERFKCKEMVMHRSMDTDKR